MSPNPLRAWFGGRPTNAANFVIPPDQPLPYSWVLTNQLAIGPMPVGLLHWQQLHEAGLRGRFSCCYPSEQTDPLLPEGWLSAQVALPDHRQQQELKLEQLLEALLTAERLLDQGGAIYLHCLAGIERSPLLAVGLTARRRGIDLFQALDWVRRCHPAALPIYEHLEVLDQVLNSMNRLNS